MNVDQSESKIAVIDSAQKQKARGNRFHLYAMAFVVIMSAIFLTFGAWLQNANVILGILATEFGLILGGSLIYAWITRQRLADMLRLRRAKFSVYVKVFFMSFFMLPIAAALNFITIVLIGVFGTLKLPELPIAEEASGLALSVFVIAVSAGICEEVMFRGAILSSFEKGMGRRKAAFLAALLFGLFHFNFANLLSPIALGMVFAYLTQITDSIFPAIFGHFMNNANAVLLSFLSTRMQENAAGAGEVIGGADEMQMFLPESLSASQIAVFVAVLLAVVAVCAIAVLALLRSIRRSYPRRLSDLYCVPVEEKMDYLTPDYALWKKQPGKLGLFPWILLGLYLVFYAGFAYMIFFMPGGV